MEQFLKNNRWSILAAGCIIQVFTGIPACWGIFQLGVVEEYAFDPQSTSMVLSYIIVAFGIGTIIGGKLQDVAGPRITSFIGAALLGGAFITSSFLPQQQIIWFYFAFSAPAGLGCGLLYPSVMSCVQKWYSDKKGFATGIIGIAVGASGAVLTLLVKAISGNFGMRSCMLWIGIIILGCCSLGAVFFQNPAKQPTASKCNTSQKNYTVLEMLKTPQYYLVFAAVAMAAPTVLLFSPRIIEFCTSRGLSDTAALWAVPLGSVASSAGRLCMPWVSDKIGRRYTDMIIFAALGGFSALFWFSKVYWVLAVYCGLTFFYSAQAAVLPTICTDLYGIQNSGVNYGFLALGMSVGSLFFPLIANCFSSMELRHILAIGGSIAGFICIFFVKPTQGKRL
ncbi:MAG: MFS transporter [Oscillospiraceae bacterium]|nr:MFS transporter [Oscillospiraceae bacterium]